MMLFSFYISLARSVACLGTLCPAPAAATILRDRRVCVCAAAAAPYVMRMNKKKIAMNSLGWRV